MSAKNDHDLLIRIDERVETIRGDVQKISQNYARTDDVVAAILEHDKQCKKRVSSRPPLPPAPKLPINKERIIWILLTAAAAAVFAGMKMFQ